MSKEVSNKQKDVCTKARVCAVCKSEVGTVFVEITNCNLCTKCQKELSDSFVYVLENRDDDEYPEL